MLDRDEETLPVTAGQGHSLEVIGVKMKEPERLHMSDAASITPADMLANVGLGLEGKTIAGGTIKRARNKIQNWARIGDTKAVCVRMVRSELIGFAGRAKKIYSAGCPCTENCIHVASRSSRQGVEG